MCCMHWIFKTLYSYLDVWFKVFPRQSVCYALVDVVECLLEYSGSHVLLFLVLIQDFQQHLEDTWTKKKILQFALQRHKTPSDCRTAAAYTCKLHLLKFLPAGQKLHIPWGKVQQTLRTLWLCCLDFHICKDGLIQRLISCTCLDNS